MIASTLSGQPNRLLCVARRCAVTNFKGNASHAYVSNQVFFKGVNVPHSEELFKQQLQQQFGEVKMLRVLNAARKCR